MSSIRTSRWVRATNYIVLVSLVASLSPLAIGPAQAQGAVRTVLLFPVGDESASGMPEIRKIATDSLQMAIDELKELECTEFARNSPLVRRAAAEGRVLPTQVETGPTDAREAISIGFALDVDTVLLTSIQSYRSLLDPRWVEVILAGQAYDVAPNYDVEAGEPVQRPTVAQAFGVVGMSRKVPGYTGTDRPLAREAIGDAAHRVAKVLSGATISEVAKPRPTVKKKDKTSRWIGYLAAVGLLAWAVSALGGEDDTRPGPDHVPPTPLPLQVEGDSAIRASWEPPTGTSLQLLHYQMQRIVNRGDWSDFGLGESSSRIHRSETSYLDFDVQPGNSYRYRIRAVYNDGVASHWVEFTGIVVM